MSITKVTQPLLLMAGIMLALILISPISTFAATPSLETVQGPDLEIPTRMILSGECLKPINTATMDFVDLLRRTTKNPSSKVTKKITSIKNYELTCEKMARFWLIQVFPFELDSDLDNGAEYKISITSGTIISRKRFK